MIVTCNDFSTDKNHEYVMPGSMNDAKVEVKNFEPLPGN